MCSCSIALSIRDLIDIAVKPVFLDIASLVSASLVNLEQFGRYRVDYMFIMGNPFNCDCDSPIYTLLQQEDIGTVLARSYEKKEINPRCFVLFKDFYDMIQPKIGEKHFLFGSFNRGVLHQAVGDTYGLCCRQNNGLPGVNILYETDTKPCSIQTVKPDHLVVIVHKGQKILEEGIKKVFYIEKSEYEHTDYWVQGKRE